MVGKKKHRGGSRGGGRPVGEKPYGEMTEEERNEYKRKSMATYRQQPSTPKKKSERYPRASTSSASGSLASPSARSARGLGRPPASPSGPRTPRTRSRLASEAKARSRRKEYLSGIRAAAANKRATFKLMPEYFQFKTEHRFACQVEGVGSAGSVCNWREFSCRGEREFPFPVIPKNGGL